MKHSVLQPRAAFAAACRAAAGFDAVQTMTRAVPDILRTGDGRAAVALCQQAGADPATLPEVLTLFATPRLGARETRRMAEALLPASGRWDDRAVADFAAVNAQLGTLGFSFPRWRYLAMGHAGKEEACPSVLETFGMTRLRRDNDRAGDGDLYGTGFALRDGPVSMEFRRAYLAVSTSEPADAVTLVIRNNSFYFGRDRLPAAVYAAFAPLKGEDMAALDAGRLDASPFAPWPAAAGGDGLPAVEKLRRVRLALDRLTDLDARLHAWMVAPDGGLPALRAAVDGGEAGMPAMALADLRLPPWFPSEARPLMRQLFTRLAGGERVFGPAGPHHRPVVLSRRDGDFPFAPASRIPPAAQIPVDATPVP